MKDWVNNPKYWIEVELPFQGAAHTPFLKSKDYDFAIQHKVKYFILLFIFIYFFISSTINFV